MRSDPFNSKNAQNYPDLSWKSTTCVSFAFGPNRPKTGPLAVSISDRLPLTFTPNFKEHRAKAR
jgi:hypothetical protein